MRNDRLQGCAPKDWEQVFQRAGVLVEELGASMSSRARATRIGRFFGPLVGREVPIQVRGRTGTAVLRVVEGRAKERRYLFEIHLDGMTGPETAPADRPSGKAPSDKAKGKDGARKKARQCDGPTAGAPEAPRESATKERKKLRKKAAGKQGRKSSRPTDDPQGRRQESGPASSGNAEKW